MNLLKSEFERLFTGSDRFFLPWILYWVSAIMLAVSIFIGQTVRSGLSVGIAGAFLVLALFNLVAAAIVAIARADG